jgi:hypothetical protein
MKKIYEFIVTLPIKVVAHKASESTKNSVQKAKDSINHKMKKGKKFSKKKIQLEKLKIQLEKTVLIFF